MLVACGDDEKAQPASDPTATVASSVEAFQGRDRAAWKSAVDALVAEGETVVPHLLPLMEHDHRSVREWVVHALGDLAPQDVDSIAALLAALEDPDDYVCLKAARALGRIGPAAYKALPALRAIAVQNAEALSGTAALAVDRIDPVPD